MSPMRLLAASAVFGVWACSTTAASLSPEEAGHIGETATVRGVVVSTEYEPNERSQPTLLTAYLNDLHRGHLRSRSTEIRDARDRPAR